MSSTPLPPSSSSPPKSEASSLPIDDEDDDAADIPLTMAASVVLTSLPRDAARALEGAGSLEGKVQIRLQPVGSAPHLTRRVFKLNASSRFEVVLKFLRRHLELKPHESVHCYVNSVFAPAPDEGIGNLWRCFKTQDELVVAYSITPAFG